MTTKKPPWVRRQNERRAKRRCWDCGEYPPEKGKTICQKCIDAREALKLKPKPKKAKRVKPPPPKCIKCSNTVLPNSVYCREHLPAKKEPTESWQCLKCNRDAMRNSLYCEDHLLPTWGSNRYETAHDYRTRIKGEWTATSLCPVFYLDDGFREYGPYESTQEASADRWFRKLPDAVVVAR